MLPFATNAIRMWQGRGEDSPCGEALRGDILATKAKDPCDNGILAIRIRAVRQGAIGAARPEKAVTVRPTPATSADNFNE